MKSQAKIPDIAKTTMNSHKGPIFVVKFNSKPSQKKLINEQIFRRRQLIMSGSQNRTIILWNPMKSLPIKTYSKSHNYEVFDICMY